MLIFCLIICICNRTFTTPPTSDLDSDSDSELDAAEQLEVDAWDLIREFATTDEMTLPDAEEALREILGAGYIQEHWQPALTAVMNAENDHDKALKAVEALAIIPFSMSDSTAISPSARPQPSAVHALPQLMQLESALLDSIQALHDRIPGHNVPTLEDLLDPPAERENADMQEFPGGEKEIVAIVQHEFAVQRGEIIEMEDVEDDESDTGEDMSRAEKMRLCMQLERVCMREAEGNLAFGLAKLLRAFHDELQEIELQSALQTS